MSSPPFFDAESFLRRHLPQYLTDFRLIRKMEDVGETPCLRILLALQEFLNGTLENIILEPLEGGMTNAINLKLIDKGKTYVIHFSHLNYDFNSKRNEITALEAASAAGIAPQVFYRKIFSDGAVIIMEFLNGKSIQLDEMREHSLIPLLIQGIKTIHQLPPEAFPTSPQVLDTLLYDMAYLEAHQWLNPKVTLVKEKLEFFAEKIHETDLLPSHWDFNPRNVFIIENRSLFIDWNLARLESSFYDLGFFSLLFNLNPEEEEEMYEEYSAKRMGEKEKAKLFIYKTLASARIGTNFYKKFLLNGGRELKLETALKIENLIRLHAMNSHEGTSQILEEIVLAAYHYFLKNAYSKQMDEAIRTAY